MIYTITINLYIVTICRNYKVLKRIVRDHNLNWKELNKISTLKKDSLRIFTVANLFGREFRGFTLQSKSQTFLQSFYNG